ncbi:hypothetical protein [Nocardia sp. MW-W600-9]
MVGAVLSFTLAAVVLVLLPGPDTLVVVRSLVRGGRRAGFPPPGDGVAVPASS